MSDAPALEAIGLQKEFVIGSAGIFAPKQTVKAVDSVSFTLPAGKTLGLVGESGCGKSTVGSLVLRLLDANAGTVRLNGRDISDLSPAEVRLCRRQMQIIFQDPFASLNPRLSVGDSVGEPLLNFGVRRRKERNEQVAEMFRRVGLDPAFMARYAHEFSGGQRQRIGIARALILNPDVVVCDEATSALDVSVQAQIINLLKDLQAERGLAFLFIAHDLAVVEHISDVVAVMYLGRIVETAPREQLFKNPLHPYTEALLAAVPIERPQDRRPRLRLKGDIPSPVNRPSGCHFHTRCPIAEGRCRAEIPSLREIAPGRLVACHLR